MEQITLMVPGKPQGKARARTGYNPKAGRVTSYTPQNTVLYENLIKTCYMQTTDSIFSDGEAISVHINAFFEPTKSTTKKKRELMLEGEYLPTKKPDIDNISKAVLDALNGLAYKDDAQVVQLSVSKQYSDKAYVEVHIKKLEK